MKTKRFLLPALLLFTTAINAQDNPLLKYLPAEVNTIISFSPLKLASNIPGESFRQSAIYIEMMKNDKGEIRAFLSDPSVSGVDLSTTFLVLISADKASTYPGSTVSMMGQLKNEALFSLMVSKLKSDADTIRTYGTNRMLLGQPGKPAIAWNNEIFVVTNGRTAEMKNRILEMITDTIDSRSFDQKMKDINENLVKANRNYCFELLTPKPGNQFGLNDHLKEQINCDGDIKIWSRGSGISQDMLKRLPFQVTSLLSRLKPLYGVENTTIIKFENGKISSLTKAYPGKEIAAAYEKYPSGQLNTNLLRHLPEGSKLLGAMMISSNTEQSKELMKQSGMNEILDSLKSKIPFDLSLLTSTFGTDGLFAVLEMPVKEKTAIEEGERPRRLFDGFDIVLAIPIKDKEKFTRLKSAMIHMYDSLKGTEAGEKYLTGANPAVKYNDTLLVISMRQETATGFINNPGTAAIPSWASDNTANPMVGMINFREIMNRILFRKPMDEDDDEEKTQFQKMVNVFDKIIFTGGVYQNGSLNSRTEMHFGNPGENAMKQLFDLLNMSIQQSGRRKDRYEKDNPPPSEEIMKREVPDPNSKDAPKIVKDTEVELIEIKQEEKKEMPPPPPPPPTKKKTTTPVKKKN